MHETIAKNATTKSMIRRSCSIMGAALALYIICLIFPEVFYAYGDFSKGTCMLVYYAVIFPIMYLIMRFVPSSPPEKRDMPVKIWLLCLIIASGLSVIANFASQWINSRISGVTGTAEDLMNPALDLLSELDFMVIFYIAVLGPLMEELIFRVLLINRLRVYGEDLAIIFSAFCFGIMHGNLSQMSYAVIVGLVLGYVYCKTGKLRYSLLMHMWINSRTLLLTLISSQENAFSLVLLVLALVITYLEMPLSVLLLGKMKDRIHLERFERPEGMSLKSLLPAMFINIGMILFIFFCMIEIINYMVGGIWG